MLEKELMWLYIPDFSKKGMMNSIKSIHGRYSEEIIWEEHPYCSGITVSDKPCPFRYEEMELVAFQPYECHTSEREKCGELIAYARFNIRNAVIEDAIL